MKAIASNQNEFVAMPNKVDLLKLNESKDPYGVSSNSSSHRTRLSIEANA